MDINLIKDAVSTFGFPITMVGVCILLIWFFIKTATAREEKLYNELAENRIINSDFVKAIQGVNNNMNAMNSKIDKVQDDVTEIKNKLDK